jgi:hypothetical protein
MNAAHAGPDGLTAELLLPVPVLALGSAGEAKGRVGAEGARLANWCVELLNELGARCPQIREGPAPGDLVLTVRGTELPAALVLVFDVSAENPAEFHVIRGARVYQTLTFSVETRCPLPAPMAADVGEQPFELSVEEVDGWLRSSDQLRAEAIAPYEDCPFVGFVLLGGRFRVVHSAGVPLVDGGLPDLRIIRFPPTEWGPWGERPSAPHPIRAEGVGEAPNSQVFHVLRRANSRPEQWAANEDEGYLFYAEDGNAVLYQPFKPTDTFGADWWSLCRESVMDALDKRFRAVKHDLLADVMDVLFLHWLRNGRPHKAGITLSQVCEYRGVSPTPDALAAHWHAIRDLRGLQLKDSFIQDQVFDIASARLPFQGNLWHKEEPPRADVVYFYSPGFFVAEALRAETGEFLAAYSPRLLHLNPYHQRDAKRLGRYLRAEWRLNPERYVGTSRPRYRTWAEHLADAGTTPSTRDTGRARDFIRALYRSIEALCDIGALAGPAEELTVTAWVESELTHPGSRTPLPRYGALEAFLARAVHLPPPPDLVPNLEHYAQRRLARAGKALPPPSAAGKAIRTGIVR